MQGFLYTLTCEGVVDSATQSRVYGILLSSMLVTQGNLLSGTLPAALGNLTELRYLALPGQRFSGTLPESYGKLTQLRLLEMGTNMLCAPSVQAGAFLIFSCTRPNEVVRAALLAASVTWQECTQAQAAAADLARSRTLSFAACLRRLSALEAGCTCSCC